MKQLPSPEKIALSKPWFDEIQRQAALNFMNLPIQAQIQGYDYNFVAKTYMIFLRDGNRAIKYNAARQFLDFIRQLNRNRAIKECKEAFFYALDYFWENFKDLLVKNDIIHLKSLKLIETALDKTRLIEDVISYEELKKRTEKIQKDKHYDDVIEAEWRQFEEEVKLLEQRS